MNRPLYLHNGTEAFIPLLLPQGLDELVYDGVTDTFWHKLSNRPTPRRFLLGVYRKVRRRKHGWAKGASIMVGHEPEQIWLQIPSEHVTKLLQAAADMRRHLPVARRINGQ